MMRAYKIVALMFALYFVAVSLAHAGGHGGRMALEGPRTERWLAGLPPEQQELEGLNYDNDIRPDALSRLGWELQKLRDQLHDAYQRVHERMRQEVGVEFVRPGRRGCRSISQFNHM